MVQFEKFVILKRRSLLVRNLLLAGGKQIPRAIKLRVGMTKRNVVQAAPLPSEQRIDNHRNPLFLSEDPSLNAGLG
jgi:hypothetical protein